MDSSSTSFNNIVANYDKVQSAILSLSLDNIIDDDTIIQMGVKYNIFDIDPSSGEISVSEIKNVEFPIYVTRNVLNGIVTYDK